MRVLVTSLLFPLPTNVARGTFVSDHVEILQKLGHDVKVVNPLPRMLKYQESSRSTHTGVAKAPKRFNHGDVDVFSPRFWGLPGHPLPVLTSFSIKGKLRSIERWLGDWRPDLIICHTVWPVAELANHLSHKWRIPWIGVVHGHDFDVGISDKNISKPILRLTKSANHLVTVSKRLDKIAKELGIEKFSVIPCHNAVLGEWKKPMKNIGGRWRKESLDILFPSDPRRPEKNHLLALQTGEELEKRGWIVGITTLRQQPRSIVWDRMLVADLTLITSKRESGPLVARESIQCGTPVVSVDVGDVASYLPEFCISSEYDPNSLADACEAALKNDWSAGLELPEQFNFESVSKQWEKLIESLVE